MALKINAQHIATVRCDAFSYLRLANNFAAQDMPDEAARALAVYDALIAYQVVLDKSFGK